jgi:hypothetical protein
MPIAEKERLSRLVCGIAELGVADHIVAGSPEPVARLAAATGAT